MRMYEIIEKKRDGKVLSHEEISFFIKGYCNDEIPDYQASALLMAIFLKGMNDEETSFLTSAMAQSGDMIDLSSIKGIKVDKHSTGGVGDKTTLILGPIVASCGVPVAKMSGKGLGHTGGTIDKLESIPGFRTGLSREEFLSNVRNSGICIAGQTGNLAPADKKLYALRDVTATVNNISLIASSIMSKKIASGADRIVLDVKTGSGAFMKTLPEAKALAEVMVKIGQQVGRKTFAVVTDMDVPLGNAIGNSLEVIEAIETLKGKGPSDLSEVSYYLAARMLQLAELGDYETCYNKVLEVLGEGTPLDKLRGMIKNQGGDPHVVDDYSLFGTAGNKFEVIAKEDGYIQGIKTDMLGTASMLLGAGRETKESEIDYWAGIILNKKSGSKIAKGDVIATLYSNKEDMSSGIKMFEKSVIISDTPKEAGKLILYNTDI